MKGAITNTWTYNHEGTNCDPDVMLSLMNNDISPIEILSPTELDEGEG